MAVVEPVEEVREHQSTGDEQSQEHHTDATGQFQEPGIDPAREGREGDDDGDDGVDVHLVGASSDSQRDLTHSRGPIPPVVDNRISARWTGFIDLEPAAKDRAHWYSKIGSVEVVAKELDST